MQKFNFVTDGSVVYRLGGNEWYAVVENNYKVLLVDTDCKVGDVELRSPWSSEYGDSPEAENGQAILDYANKIADKYFSNIKYAIIPRTVFAGTGKIENAYMWPMSKSEFGDHKVISGNIVKNSNSHIWTRSCAGVCFNNVDYYAWYLGDPAGILYSSNYVNYVLRVAPAFYLRKSAIDHISDVREIILKIEA